MKILDAFKIVRNKGLAWTLFRTKYEFKKRTGIMKNEFTTKEKSDAELFKDLLGNNIKTKADIIKQIKLKKDNFFINSSDIDDYRNYIDNNLNYKDKKNLIKVADDAINGKILCFSKWIGDYGDSINWHMNPISKYKWPRDKHWVDIEELSIDSGDVKYVWEASRFPQIYYFVRAYTLTKDEKYVKAYWDQIESWIENNSYNEGINWKCGQEISFRMFSWVFGLYVFIDSPYSTDDRIFSLMKNLYQSAIRIENNIEFAVKAVQNNHSISEAAGLFTFGLLFPYFKDSERLLNKGKKYLEQEGLKQIYDDGSYIQDSMNYHRLMLQDYSWCYRLADINDISFSFELTNKINKSIEFLYQMQDDISGYVPNYGNNDGALIFPLTSCDYLDYRPQLNTIYYILNGERLFEQGKYDEELLWFSGIEALNSEVQTNIKRSSKRFDSGGYYTFRNEDTFGMIKCGMYKKKAGPSDMLHFDLWYEGVNVLCDIGSYSYNPEKEFKDYFDSTENHNTITVNNQDQVKKGPRFLTISWANGYVNKFKKEPNNIYFSGYHDGYKNTHTREVKFQNKSCMITDTIENIIGEKVKIKLNWNIGSKIKKIDNNKYKIIIGDKKDIIIEIFSINNHNINIYKVEEFKNWRSLYYGEKISMNRLICEIDSKEKNEEIITNISWR